MAARVMNFTMLETDLISAVNRDSRRLLVALHGLGDSMEGYRWLPTALRLPWMNYLLVNAPDPYYTGFSWYDFANDPAPGIQRSRQLLVELLDSLRADFPSEETVLFGFSQGCLMTLETGLRYSHRLAALIGISGYVHNPQQLLSECSPAARQQRLLVTHGTEDPLIPFSKVKTQMDALKSAGLQLDWRAFAKAHTIAGDEEIDVIREFIVKAHER